MKNFEMIFSKIKVLRQLLTQYDYREEDFNFRRIKLYVSLLSCRNCRRECIKFALNAGQNQRWHCRQKTVLRLAIRISCNG